MYCARHIETEVDYTRSSAASEIVIIIEPFFNIALNIAMNVFLSKYDASAISITHTCMVYIAQQFTDKFIMHPAYTSIIALLRHA